MDVQETAQPPTFSTPLSGNNPCPVPCTPFVEQVKSEQAHLTRCNCLNPLFLQLGMSIQYLPDFGRPIGAEGPISSDHLFKDTDDIKDVKLRVTQSQDNDPRHHHWTIFWVVANCGDIEVHRRVHVVREIGASHLTNWGAVTSSMGLEPTTRDIFIKRMTLAERKRLEEIGNTTPVRVPDGDWNCQNWVYSVLRTAEKEGLLAPQESVSVVIRALGVKFNAPSS